MNTSAAALLLVLEGLQLVLGLLLRLAELGKAVLFGRRDFLLGTYMYIYMYGDVSGQGVTFQGFPGDPWEHPHTDDSVI